MTSRFTIFLTFASGLVVALLAAVLLPTVMNLVTVVFPGSGVSDSGPGGRGAVKRLASFGFGEPKAADSVATLTAETMPAVLKGREVGPNDEAEALAAVNVARELTSLGKYDKAYKLYEHALALNAKHPDVLNEYGEFLEKHKKDVVTAEHMYCRALTVSPTHTKALSNRQRALPLVEEIDQSSFNRIDKKRDWLIKVPDSHPGMRRMKKESYFRHIYHTTAMEGNTFTLAQGRALLETGMAIGGKSIIEHNEILGLDAALSYINSTLVHRIGAITLSDVLEIHRRVMGHVDPIEAGRVRTSQVYVSDYIPPAAQHVPRFLTEFIDWLNSDDALNNIHPIEFAALAHYKLVSIHPFYDGNGRTSRLVMNLVLMQAGYPPIIIRVEDKHEYYQHLDTANKGDVRPFIRFIARCTEQTLDEFLLAASERPNISFPEINGFKDDGRTIIIEDEEKNSTTESHKNSGG